GSELFGGGDGGDDRGVLAAPLFFGFCGDEDSTARDRLNLGRAYAAATPFLERGSTHAPSGTKFGRGFTSALTAGDLVTGHAAYSEMSKYVAPWLPITA